MRGPGFGALFAAFIYAAFIFAFVLSMSASPAPAQVQKLYYTGPSFSYQECINSPLGTSPPCFSGGSVHGWVIVKDLGPNDLIHEDRLLSWKLTADGPSLGSLGPGNTLGKL